MEFGPGSVRVRAKVCLVWHKGHAVGSFFEGGGVLGEIPRDEVDKGFAGEEFHKMVRLRLVEKIGRADVRRVVK